VLSRHTSILRRCLAILDRISSSALAFSAANRLLLIAAFPSQLTNSLRFFAPVEVTFAWIPGSRSLCASRVWSSSGREITVLATISLLLPLLRHLFLFARWSATRGFFVRWYNAVMSALLDPRISVYNFPWILSVSSNECISNKSSINRKKAYDETHQDMEYH